MCGIFAVINDKTNQAPQTVLEGLKKLEYRGYDSWGIAVKPENSLNLEIEKHIGKIGEAKTSLSNGKIAIGHTRWATHGGVFDKNAHPHLDCNKNIAVIHNGIIENYLEIKEKLIKNNHKFLSDTDTEVVAHLIEEKLKNKKNYNIDDFKKIVFQSFKKLTGSNAIGVLDSKTETIIACRNGSPLVVGIDEKNQQYFLASDIPALLKHTKKIYFLNDNEAVVLNKNFFQVYDLKTEKSKKIKIEIVDLKEEDAEKEGYPHFLLKEIDEQKKTILKTIEKNLEKIEEITLYFKKAKKIIFTGCGTAYHCALFGKYFFAKNGFDAEAYQANEFNVFSKTIDKKTLIIAISQSGETADTLLAVKQGKAKGSKIISIINNRGSTLERLSDFFIPIQTGPEIAVVSTKAFTSQLAVVYLIAKILSGKKKEGIENIKKLSKELNKWLNEDLKKQIINLAKRLLNEKNIYIIGKELNYPASLEFALKIKETSYTHAEAFASGELKHGVIALIEKNTPCFVLALNDENKNDIISSAIEVKSRNGFVIGISPFYNSVFDFYIKTPDLKEIGVIPNIIVGQLLGYFLGIGKGADPDKPRNLAKSVTVK